MKCKCCGSERFIAHQIIRADIMVDGDNEFQENLFGGLEAHIYDSERPYGPYTCPDCGAEYDELDDGAEPTNIHQTSSRTWAYNDTGKPVAVNRKVYATYISEWDDETEVPSSCIVNLTTHCIEEIQRYRLAGGLGILTGRYVDIGLERYEVVEEEDYDPDDTPDAFYEKR